MAWVAEADFNGLSDGDLNGQGGGTGWTGNWAGGTNYDVQGTTRYEGAKAIIGDNSSIDRTLTTAVSGDGNIVYFAARRSVTNSGQSYVHFQSAGGSRCGIIMNNAGAIKTYPGSASTILASYSANTWYVFKLTMNVASNTFDVDYSTGAYGSAGTWTTGVAGVAMSSTGNITKVTYDLDTNGTQTQLFDYISGVSPFTAAGPANLKSLDGNLKANIKSYNGNVLANVKSISGNA